jgi:hypothetical protein
MNSASFFILFYFNRNDEELNRLFGNVTIAEGGVIPNIHSVLIPKTSLLNPERAAMESAKKESSGAGGGDEAPHEPVSRKKPRAAKKDDNGEEKV